MGVRQRTNGNINAIQTTTDLDLVESISIGGGGCESKTRNKRQRPTFLQMMLNNRLSANHPSYYDYVPIPMNIFCIELLVVWVLFGALLLLIVYYHYHCDWIFYNNDNRLSMSSSIMSHHDVDVNTRILSPRQMDLIKRWPILLLDKESSSIKDPEEFETISHPALAYPKNVTMTVPRFFMNSPIREDGKLMSKQQGESVGIKVPVALAKGNRTVDMATIFVSIASYRDGNRCRHTLESLFQRAKYPYRLRIGIIDQIKPKTADIPCNVPMETCSTHPLQALCMYSNHIDRFELDATLSVGPIFARHLGNRMYRGEYFSLQTDAHMSFVKNWDNDIESQFYSASNEMAVLSAYPSDISKAINETTGLALHQRRAVMCNSKFEKDLVGGHIRHSVQPEVLPTVRGSPQLQPYWAAGFSFSRGHFIVNVPYDQYIPMVFQGEEIAMAVRAWTFGYDFYALERNVCFHIYVEGANKEKREKVPLFWENKGLYHGSMEKALLRLLGIIGMNKSTVKLLSWDHTHDKRYGMGQVRTNSKFFELFGIHLSDHTMEENLCPFVRSGKMHHIFVPALRHDGMGIDYNKIDFKFNGTIFARKHV